ncbi:hypothetical protein GOP47_0010674 [Adiantum capillus-veneris]|uniref:Uncharacterized protein n=1 Tax=Adiantum capillus-veneris TaxID=13818 RepID=A0A9D4UVD5_ADICA|nr:hypothetical protein GOP47_0010674 [Adiantum capillus-veneris]
MEKKVLEETNQSADQGQHIPKKGESSKRPVQDKEEQENESKMNSDPVVQVVEIVLIEPPVPAVDNADQVEVPMPDFEDCDLVHEAMEKEV